MGLESGTDSISVPSFSEWLRVFEDFVIYHVLFVTCVTDFALVTTHVAFGRLATVNAKDLACLGVFVTAKINPVFEAEHFDSLSCPTYELSIAPVRKKVNGLFVVKGKVSNTSRLRRLFLCSFGHFRNLRSHAESYRAIPVKEDDTI